MCFDCLANLILLFPNLECVNWKKTEIELFHRAIMKVDKDFFQIAKLVCCLSIIHEGHREIGRENSFLMKPNESA